MLIRQRSTVIQLYRSAYDPETKRSRTVTLGSFARTGQPAEELLGRLTGKERAALTEYLERREAARQLEEIPRLLLEVPEALRRIAAWMRLQPKSAETKRAAKALRDGYGELYAVMRSLGVSKLRSTKAAASSERAKPARPRRRLGEASSPSAEEGLAAPSESEPT